MGTPTKQARGEWIDCGCCVAGVVSVYSASDFEGPGECRFCIGGQIWRYPSGALALYPAGPFVGRDGSPASPTPTAPEA